MNEPSLKNSLPVAFYLATIQMAEVRVATLIGGAGRALHCPQDIPPLS